MPNVLIFRSGTGYKMKVEGVNTPVEVYRSRVWLFLPPFL
jgi:hypothetical protein